MISTAIPDAPRQALDADSPRELSARAFPWTLLLIVAIGAGLRFYALGAKSLWLDEASSFTFAKMPFVSFLRTMWYGEANMAFYYLLLRGWLHLGDSEAWLRSLSALFAVAAIPAVYQFGKRFLTPRVGLLGAAFLAANSFHVRYAQETRSYSLLALLLLFAAYFFLLALENPSRKIYWIGYAFLSILAIYSQVFAVFVLASYWLVLTPLRIRKVWIPAFLSVAAIGVGSLPIGTVMLFQNKGQLDWVAGPSLKGVLAALQDILGVAPEDAPVSLQGCAILAVYGLILIFGIWTSLSRPRMDGSQTLKRVAMHLLCAWALFPIVAMLILSFARPIFVPRYLLMCVPPVMLLLGESVNSIAKLSQRQAVVSVGLLLIVLGISFYGTRRYFSSFSTYGNNWRGLTSYIVANRQPGDALIFYNYSGHRVYEYYLQRRHETGLPADSPTILFLPQFDAQTVERVSSPYERVWLVLDRSVQTPQAARTGQLIRESLETRFHLSGERVFEGTGPIRASLYAVGSAQADPH